MSLSPSLEQRLIEFRDVHGVAQMGYLGTVLVVTNRMRQFGLPFDDVMLLSPKGSQVAGLNGAAINKVLRNHGVTQMVGTEAGRTSRGTPALAKFYFEFINEMYLKFEMRADELDDVEAWWVERFVDFFNSQPFKLNYDASKNLASVIRNLLDQALLRQKKSPGKTYVGAVLQHLVGAKLELALPELKIVHNGASVADTVSSRSGDFVIDNAIIHCTTAPGEALLRKCSANLQAGLNPIILTTTNKISVAEGLAENIGIEGRVEIMDALQFLAANLYEMSLFQGAERKITVFRLIKKYNEIVAEHEADPSLRIAFD